MDDEKRGRRYVGKCFRRNRRMDRCYMSRLIAYFLFVVEDFDIFWLWLHNVRLPR